MPTSLYQDDLHRNLLLEDASDEGLAVQSNHHVIVHGDQAMLLDPGGHKSFERIHFDIQSLSPGIRLRYLFLSHQDPDILAATNSWLMVSQAEALISTLWLRFLPHFGLDTDFESRIIPLPDQGTWLDLGGAPLVALPAHFLHACGNFQLYDPRAKILYSGDLGASFGMDYRVVSSFSAHVPLMEGFHRRYMASNRALRAWAQMIRHLDIEIIAPQHGAAFVGKEMCQRFITWCENLTCGCDLMTDLFTIPTPTHQS